MLAFSRTRALGQSIITILILLLLLYFRITLWEINIKYQKMLFVLRFFPFILFFVRVLRYSYTTILWKTISFYVLVIIL